MPPRSPVVFWLLLAATISLDAVVLTWLPRESYVSAAYAAVACHALLLSQLSIVCAWSALHSSKPLWVQIVPVLATIVMAVAAAISFDTLQDFRASVLDHLAYLGLHAMLLMAALWLVQRTAFWRRRTGVVLSWHYSLLQLLIVMTLVAVLAGALRRSPVFDAAWLNLTFTLSSVMLATSCVVVWTFRWHWILRVAATFGTVFFLGIVFFWGAALFSGGFIGSAMSRIIGGHYLIQAVLLDVWLCCGPILPVVPRPATTPTKVEDAE